MLVLTRKLDQSITIGDPAGEDQAVEITIIEVKGDQVRLGINAPRDVTVDRKEIWLEKQGEDNRQENEAVSHG